MRRKRTARTLTVVASYAQEPSAPTLEQVQANAAPLVAQLLAQALAERQEKRSA